MEKEHDIRKTPEIDEAGRYKLIAGYHIFTTIGVGSFGEVRLARQASTGREVALKIVDTNRYPNGGVHLLKEISILRNAIHENIVGVYEVLEGVKYPGEWCSDCACTSVVEESSSTFHNHISTPSESTGQYVSLCKNCGCSTTHHSGPEIRVVTFVALELAAGGEIFGLLSHSGPFPLHVARTFFRQLIFGLDYCHSRAIIHRDIKPENLVLSHDFSLRICDFGLSVIVNNNCYDSECLHSGVGSISYSAPEILYNEALYEGRGYRGPPADIWSSAVILFIMLTGRPPFRRPLIQTIGPDPNYKRCRHFGRIMNGYYPKEVPSDAQELISQILVMDPDMRPSISSIKDSSFFNGEYAKQDEISVALEVRSRDYWCSQGKPEMAEVLSQLRMELENENHISDVNHNSIEDITESRIRYLSRSPIHVSDSDSENQNSIFPFNEDIISNPNDFVIQSPSFSFRRNSYSFPEQHIEIENIRPLRHNNSSESFLFPNINPNPNQNNQNNINRNSNDGTLNNGTRNGRRGALMLSRDLLR